MGIWIFACDGCLPLLLPQPFHELCERPFGRPVGTVAIVLGVAWGRLDLQSV